MDKPVDNSVPSLTKRLVIEYDVLNNAISVPENDMTTFEAFGMLEAAKTMIANAWLDKTEGRELP